MSAIALGSLGSFLTFVVGMRFLQMESGEILQTLLVSLVAGFVALLLTIQATQGELLGKRKVKGIIGTWSFVSFFYFLILLSFAPPMRDFRRIAYLFFPLMMSLFYIALPYGPIQDRWVRKRQRNARHSA